MWRTSLAPPRGAVESFASHRMRKASLTLRLLILTDTALL